MAEVGVEPARPVQKLWKTVEHLIRGVSMVPQLCTGDAQAELRVGGGVERGVRLKKFGLGE